MYVGRAQSVTHCDSNTSCAVGRCSGFQASIHFKSLNSASYSSSPNASMSLDRRGFCTQYSKRRSHDHMSAGLLNGLPTSSYHLDLLSHFSHHSLGIRPCSSTCCAVISSCGARKPSISERCAKSSKITHPRLQMSDASVRGVLGSKKASGGR